MIISVGREFGSGGHEIAEKLAKIYDIPLLDKNILEEIAREKGMDIELLGTYDEKPKNFISSRRVRGLSSSLEEAVAEIEFEHIKEKSRKGESFVIVGRCSESILRDDPNMVSIFVLADMEEKKKRIMERRGILEDSVEQYIIRTNKRRKNYHNFYCKGQWGDSRNYNISINSSCLGIDGTVDVLKDFIDRFFANK